MPQNRTLEGLITTELTTARVAAWFIEQLAAFKAAAPISPPSDRTESNAWHADLTAKLREQEAHSDRTDPLHAGAMRRLKDSVRQVAGKWRELTSLDGDVLQHPYTLEQLGDRFQKIINEGLWVACCVNCGERRRGMTHYTPSGQRACQGCIDGSRCVCEPCGSVSSTLLCTAVRRPSGSHRYVCPACMPNETLFNCTHCGSMCSGEPAAVEGATAEQMGDFRLCSSCSPIYRICACGAVTHERHSVAAAMDNHEDDDDVEEGQEGRDPEGHMCRRCYSEAMSDVAPEYWNPEAFGGSGNAVIRNATDASDIGSKRTYGVELEVCYAKGMKRIPKDEKQFWTAKQDGSLPRATGVEMASVILAGDKGLEIIKRLCAFAKENAWAVDKRAGFHLHVGLGDLNMKQVEAVALGYHLTYKMWSCWVSPSRISGRYSRSHGGVNGPNRVEAAVAMPEGAFIKSLQSGDRYRWVNWESYNHRKTVEIRFHQGTIDYEKISAWIKAHVRFVDWCAAQGTKKAVGEELLKQQQCTRRAFLYLTQVVWKDRKLGRYLRSRAQKFDYGARNLPPSNRKLRKDGHEPPRPAIARPVPASA